MRRFLVWKQVIPRAAALAIIAGLLASVAPTALVAPSPSAAVAAQEPVAVPPGFADEPVVALDLPTSLEVLPDGTLLVGAQAGLLSLVRDGAPTPALDLSDRVCFEAAAGLLGLAVDPAFTDNRFVYTYQTAKRAETGGCVNQVSRWVLGEGGTIDPSSERRLIDNGPTPAAADRGKSLHNGGALGFGTDGYLYVTVGDGGCKLTEPSVCHYKNDNARHRHSLLGKVLRIDRDGAAPADNPFANDPGAVSCALVGVAAEGETCREIFASGLRNPFRMAFDPDAPANAVRFFVNDVGGNDWEEVNSGAAGADYGWSVREGACAAKEKRKEGNAAGGEPACDGTTDFTDPIHAYAHETGCASITGGAFVPDAAGWPAASADAYLYGDFVCGKLFALLPNGNGGYDATEFASGLGGVADLAFGPDGALYYATLPRAASGGEVRRIVFTTTETATPAA